MLLAMLSMSMIHAQKYDAHKHHVLNEQFMAQMQYLRTRAIKAHQYVDVSFYRNAPKMKVREQRTKLRYDIPIYKGHVADRNRFVDVPINKEGEIDRFGSLYIEFEDGLTSKFIFHLEKGRMRVENL